MRALRRARSARAQPPNSWPNVTGIASIRCVRPVLTMSLQLAARAARSSAQMLQRRQQLLADASAALTWIAVGITSLRALAHVDVIVRMHLAPARARRQRARSPRWHSCCVLVPEPVWNTSIGKLRVVLALRRPPARPCGSPRPAPRQQARGRALASRRGRLDQPERADERRAACGRPLIGKFSTARCVCAPHSASAGTCSSPMLSCSMRNAPVRWPSSDAPPLRRSRCMTSRGTRGSIATA